MKIAHTLVLAAAMMATVGCKTVTAKLPVGAVDTVDATANEILQPAHAFALTITNAVLSTDPNVHIELTAAQKAILVDLNKSINIADTLEIAYHAHPTAANATVLQAATATVQTNLSAAQVAIAPGK